LESFTLFGETKSVIWNGNGRFRRVENLNPLTANVYRNHSPRLSSISLCHVSLLVAYLPRSVRRFSLENVELVGGSWVVLLEALAAEDFDALTIHRPQRFEYDNPIDEAEYIRVFGPYAKTDLEAPDMADPRLVPQPWKM